MTEITETDLVAILAAMRKSEDAYDHAYEQRFAAFMGADADEDDFGDDDPFIETLMVRIGACAARRLVDGARDEPLVSLDELKAGVDAAVARINESLGNPKEHPTWEILVSMIDRSYERIITELLGVKPSDHDGLRRRIDAILAEAERYKLAPMVFLSIDRSWEDVIRRLYSPAEYRDWRLAEYDELLRQAAAEGRFTVVITTPLPPGQLEEALKERAEKVIADHRAKIAEWVMAEVKYLWPDVSDLN